MTSVSPLAEQCGTALDRNRSMFHERALTSSKVDRSGGMLLMSHREKQPIHLKDNSQHLFRQKFPSVLCLPILNSTIYPGGQRISASSIGSAPWPAQRRTSLASTHRCD